MMYEKVMKNLNYSKTKEISYHQSVKGNMKKINASTEIFYKGDDT